MMHGYAALMRDFNTSITKTGLDGAVADWQVRLGRFAASQEFTLDAWSGDLFDKRNPLWQRVGIVKPGRAHGALTVLNTGAARAEAGRVLRQLAELAEPTFDLRFLTRG